MKYFVLVLRTRPRYECAIMRVSSNPFDESIQVGETFYVNPTIDTNAEGYIDIDPDRARIMAEAQRIYPHLELSHVAKRDSIYYTE